MIDKKSDYKKVKQEQFGSGNRITVDGNVYGIREQKLIKRNEDVVYLEEVNGVVDKVHDDSILLDFPFYSDEVKFPTPPLASFVDPDKFEALEISGQDIHLKTGGEDPDISALRRQWQQILENRQTKIDENRQTLEDYKKDLDDEKKRESDDLKSRKEDEYAKLPRINEKYINAVENANKKRSDTEESLAAREETALERYKKKQITKEEYNALIIDIDTDRQNMHLTHYKDMQDAIVERDGSLQEVNHATSLIDMQNNNLTSKYNKLYEEKEDELALDLEEYDDETYWPQVEPIYRASNFGAGVPDNSFERELDKSINDLDIYCATDGMYRSYAWNLGKNSTEYMDRLFADWEKLGYRRVSNYSYKNRCPGVIEHYKGEDAGGYHWTYNRFLQGLNYTYYDYDYDNDPYDTATFDVIDGNIDFRLGSRYDVGKIKALYAITRIYGFGVNGNGYSFHLIPLTKVKVVDEDRCAEYDAIEDKFLKAKEDAEKTYNDGMKSANEEYEQAVSEAESTYSRRISEIDASERSRIAETRASYMTNLHQLVIEYNTLVYDGKNPREVLNQIFSQLEAMNNSINSIKMDEKANRDMASETRSTAISNADDNRAEELDRLLKEMSDSIDDAAEIQSEEISELYKSVNDEYNSLRDDAFEAYENAMDAATQRHDSAVKTLADQESALWESLMESWKAEHGGEEPGDWSDPEVQAHFQPYFRMVEAHAPQYNSLLEQMYNDRCSAEVAYARADADILKFNENARELWRFDGKEYTNIAKEFSKKDQTYGNGINAANVASVELLVAEMDYNWKMDAEFKDYEEEDRKHEEELALKEKNENGENN